MKDQIESAELSKEELHEKNMRWFSHNFPALHGNLKKFKPLSELIDEGEGWHNLNFSGQKLYAPAAKEHIENKLDIFREAPDRIVLATPQPAHFDKYAANFMHRVLERYHDEEIELSLNIPMTKGYFLFCFGLGIGEHIPALVEESSCQCLVIIEPNFEFLAQSLYVLDWQAVHEVIEDRGGYFDLQVGGNDDYLFSKIKSVIRVVNPTSFDGTLLFINYNNPQFVNLINRMRQDAHLIMSGLGFYFDETIMIANTHANLSGGDANMIRYSPQTIRKYAAFIIGSGPSLDRDIEWIKENQNNAVIFACGSAIMPLMRAGIQPDFHVDLENVPELYPMLQDTVKYVDVSKVHMLASTTLDARISGFYDKMSYFFRPALSSYPMFARDEDQPLHNGSPSVTNAGLALAQNFGFREMYLFGADMGSKSQGQVHSKNSWQNCDEGWEVDIQHNIPVRGNFGGTVYTYQGMNWTRDELELAIMAFQNGRLYYNCSDGAFIAGTIAKHSRSIKLTKHSSPKDVEVKSITDNFAPYPEEEFKKIWDDKVMCEYFADYSDRMLACFENPEEIENKLALTKINKQLFAHGAKGLELGVSMIVRGSVWQALIAVEYYLLRIADEDELKLALDIYKEEFTKLINYIRKRSIEDLGHLTEREWAPIDREVISELEAWD
ncbi:MAG: motility associated factor glycosyltransferase family protein [Magnetovibrio sp.]|nr:motility associated factor glycosyltransferase family protein [Magnetovibrio sp.]